MVLVGCFLRGVQGRYDKSAVYIIVDADFPKTGGIQIGDIFKEVRFHDFDIKGLNMGIPSADHDNNACYD